MAEVKSTNTISSGTSRDPAQAAKLNPRADSLPAGEAFRNNDATLKEALGKRGEGSSAPSTNQGAYVDRLLTDLRQVAQERSNPELALEVARKVPGAIQFSEKFERQKSDEAVPFKSGEKVAAIVLVDDIKRNSDGTFSVGLRNQSDILDIRHSDKFVLQVSEKEAKSFREMQGIPFQAVVEVSEGRYAISNSYEYKAKLIASLGDVAINPTPFQIDRAPLRSSMIVEGTVHSFQTDPTTKGQYAVILTKERELVPIYIANGSLALKSDASGQVENIQGKKAEIGDSVRIRTMVAENEKQVIPPLGFQMQDMLVRPPQNLLTAIYDDQTVLLAPSSGRAAEYQKVRAEISSEFALLSESGLKGRFEETRDIAARLIKKELTESGLSELRHQVQKLPEKERPLIPESRHEVNTLLSEAGIDVDRLTKQQFLAYIEKQASENTAHHYLVRFLNTEKFTPEEKAHFTEVGLAASVRELQKLSANTDVPAKERYSFQELYRVGEYLNWLDSDSLSPGVAREVVRAISTFSKDPELWNDGMLNGRMKESLQLLREKAETSPEVAAALKEDRGLLAGAAETLARSNAYGFELATEVAPLLKLSDPHFSSKEASHAYITELAERMRAQSSYFDAGMKEFDKRGYTFVIYNPEDEKASKIVHALAASNTVGAITVKEEKKVYIMTETLIAEALRSGVQVEETMKGMLANELVHVRSSLLAKPYSAEEAQLALKRAAVGDFSLPTWTHAFAVVREEAVSEMYGALAERGKLEGRPQVTVDDAELERAIQGLLLPSLSRLLSQGTKKVDPEVLQAAKRNIEEVSKQARFKEDVRESFSELFLTADP